MQHAFLTLQTLRLCMLQAKLMDTPVEAIASIVQANTLGTLLGYRTAFR